MREATSGSRCCTNRASYSDGGGGAADAVGLSKACRGVGSLSRAFHVVN